MINNYFFCCDSPAGFHNDFLLPANCGPLKMGLRARELLQPCTPLNTGLSGVLVSRDFVTANL